MRAGFSAGFQRFAAIFGDFQGDFAVIELKSLKIP
jgi:hypothetical protein